MSQKKEYEGPILKLKICRFPFSPACAKYRQ